MNFSNLHGRKTTKTHRIPTLCWLLQLTQLYILTFHRTALGSAFGQLRGVHHLEGQRSLANANAMEQIGHFGHLVAAQSAGHQSGCAPDAGKDPRSQMVQHAVRRAW